MVNRNVLLCVLFSLTLQSCEAWTQKGFRFRGVYVAEKSGYRVEMIAQGVRDPEKGTIIDIHRFVQICPTLPNREKPLRFRITTQRSQPFAVLVGEDNSIPAQNWDGLSLNPVTQVAGLERMIARVGSGRLYWSESMATFIVLGSSPPISPFITGLTVKQSDWNDDYQFDRSQPQSSWIDRSELSPCA